jgi:beta-lactam-binding protein with PASTA domain
MPVDEAIAELDKAGFDTEVYEPFGISPLNRVASQDPEGGTKAPLGSTVRLGII